MHAKKCLRALEEKLDEQKKHIEKVKSEKSDLEVIYRTLYESVIGRLEKSETNFEKEKKGKGQGQGQG